MWLGSPIRRQRVGSIGLAGAAAAHRLFIRSWRFGAMSWCHHTEDSRGRDLDNGKPSEALRLKRKYFHRGDQKKSSQGEEYY